MMVLHIEKWFGKCNQTVKSLSQITYAMMSLMQYWNIYTLETTVRLIMMDTIKFGLFLITWTKVGDFFVMKKSFLLMKVWLLIMVSRYGYKVWTLATSKGAGVIFERYCGKDTQLNDNGLGQGPSVVLGLSEKAELEPGPKIYMDKTTCSPLFLCWRSCQRRALEDLQLSIRIDCQKYQKNTEKKNVACGEMDVLYTDLIRCWLAGKTIRQFIWAVINGQRLMEDLQWVGHESWRRK